MSSDLPSIPGIELARQFFHEAVQPVLAEQFPDLHYAAALIGPGSEVLGFDSAMSTDHHWGPRAMLFLAPADGQYAAAIREVLRHTLPYSFRGYPTNFTPPIEAEGVTQLLEAIDRGPVNHRVEIFTLEEWFRAYMDLEPGAILGDAMTAADWLSVPAHKLRTVVAGAVYCDGVGDLTRIREKLAYYPRDVWLYMLASGWERIGQEEHVVGRAGWAGDEIGARVIAARLVHDLMYLCFLMARQYPPYSKWFGTAFARLPVARRLTPALHAVFDARDWRQREQHLCAAYETVAALHNELGITDPLPVRASGFHDRPFQVIQGGVFAQAITRQIADPALGELVQRPRIGGVEQFTTSTDLLCDTGRTETIRGLYVCTAEHSRIQ